MTSLSFSRIALVVLASAVASSTACKSSSNPQAEAELIRTTERARLRALVEGNIEVARSLHADDFQLINPGGKPSSKEQYLGAIASGELDYIRWEPEEMEVRLYGEAAIIRYQSQLEVTVQGQNLGLRRHWHTDSYEKRNGHWQVVWSQATVVK